MPGNRWNLEPSDGQPQTLGSPVVVQASTLCRHHSSLMPAVSAVQGYRIWWSMVIDGRGQRCRQPARLTHPNRRKGNECGQRRVTGFMHVKGTGQGAMSPRQRLQQPPASGKRRLVLLSERRPLGRKGRSRSPKKRRRPAPTSPLDRIILLWLEMRRDWALPGFLNRLAVIVFHKSGSCGAVGRSRRGFKDTTA